MGGADWGTADYLNPLAHLPAPNPADDTQPFLLNCTVIPMEKGSRVEANKDNPANVRINPVDGISGAKEINLPGGTKPPRIDVQGKIKFLAHAYDRVNVGGSHCGLYKLEYYVGDALKYRIVFDDIAYAQRKKVEFVFSVHPPYESRIGSGDTQFFYKMYKDGGYVDNITVHENDGVWDTTQETNGEHTVAVKAYDYHNSDPKTENITVVTRNPTVWVDAATGSDSTGVGSLGNPYKTITRGLVAAGNLDTIFVQAGTYDAALGESFPINMKSGVMLQGAGADSVVVDGGSASSVIQCENADADTIIEGFTITNGIAGVLVLADSSPTIRHNIIEGHSDTGVWVSDGAAATVVNNLVRDNTRYGIYMVNTHGIGLYMVSANPGGLVQLHNNTIIGNGSHGIYASQHSIGEIVNNIIEGNSGYGICFGSSTAVSTQFCNIYNNGSGAANATLYPGAGMNYADPQFVSGPGGNYYLSQTAAGDPIDSLCVNAAEEITANTILDRFTTRRDELEDDGRLDVGFHYCMVFETPTPTNTPTDTPTAPTFTPTPPAQTPTPWPTETPLPTAGATDLLADNMESGPGEWSEDGSIPGPPADSLWHLVSTNSGSPYYSAYGKAHSGTNSWWYGQNATGDYNTGARNWGALYSPYIIVTKPLYLSFQSWEKTEGTGRGLDTRIVYLTFDYGVNWVPIYQSTDNSGDWREVTVELAQYVGETIRFKFEFDSFDEKHNGYRGWYIDDFRLGDRPVPATSNRGVLLIILIFSALIILTRFTKAAAR